MREKAVTTEQMTLPLSGVNRTQHAPATSPIVLDGMTINGHRLVLQDGGKELERTCTGPCHQRQPLSCFGLRLMASGEIRVQAQCSLCRNKKVLTDSHLR